MSSLRVNKIVNLNDDGPIEFSKGLTILANNPIASGAVVVNTTGVVTATSFRGSGAGLTGIPGVETKKAIAMSFIF